MGAAKIDRQYGGLYGKENETGVFAYYYNPSDHYGDIFGVNRAFPQPKSEACDGNSICGDLLVGN
jgi:hypothetical protein